MMILLLLWFISTMKCWRTKILWLEFHYEDSLTFKFVDSANDSHKELKQIVC